MIIVHPPNYKTVKKETGQADTLEDCWNSFILIFSRIFKQDLEQKYCSLDVDYCLKDQGQTPS